MYSNRETIYKYENKSSIFWYISLFGLGLLSLMAFISLVESVKFYKVVFFIIFIGLLTVQVFSKITGRYPFLEISSTKIKWGVNKKSHKSVAFENLKEVVFDYGVDDNNILMVEKTGDMHKIYKGYHFCDADSLKRVFEEQKTKYNFMISQSEICSQR